MRQQAPLRFALLLACVTLTGAASKAVADVPRQLPFQGRLTHPDGSSKPAGLYSVTFRIKSVPGGIQRWISTQDVLQGNGMFHELLGPVPSLPSFDERLCLSVQVAGEPELPCIELVTAPLAINADEVLANGVRREAIAPGAVGAADLAANAIQTADFANFAVTQDDIDSSLLVRDMSCLVSLPATVNFSPVGDEVFMCSVNITVPARTAAIVRGQVDVEQGCSDMGNAPYGIWSRMTVNHQHASIGQVAVDRVFASSQVVTGNPSEGTEQLRRGGHASLESAVAVILEPGVNGISFQVMVDGTRCEPKEDHVWAKYGNHSGQVVIFGRAP